MGFKFPILIAGFCLVTGAVNAEELNAYSIMPEKYASKIFAEFTKDTGIKVNFLRFSSGEALARLTAEKKNPQVDVMLGGPADTYAAGMQAPTKWADLLDPRYKNGLQMADARTSGTATERIYSLVKVMGEDEAFAFQKKLNANIQMYTKSGAGGAMPIATGQCASGIFYIVDALDIAQQGYPVKITYPEDGVSFGIEATGVIAGGKNNEQAKKFVDWATSKLFAEFIVANKINYVPARTDVETQNPILDLSKINVITTDVTWKGDNRKRFTQRWINEVIR